MDKNTEIAEQKVEAIKDFEGLYEVDSRSRIFRIYKTKEKRECKPFLRNGYLSVGLSTQNKIKTRSVHRIVAEAFIPNPENKPTVNHIDGNKLNNSIKNLEWADHSEQILHAIKIGKFTPVPPTKKGDKLSKITKDKMSVSQLKRYNTPPSNP